MYINDRRVMGDYTDMLHVVPVDDLREWIVKCRDAGITDVAEHPAIMPERHDVEDWLFEIDNA